MIVKEGLLHTIIEMPQAIAPERIDATLKEFADQNLDEDGKEFILQMTDKKQLVKSDITFIKTLRDTITITGGKLYIVDVNEPVFNALCYMGIDKQIHVFKNMIDFEKDHGPVLIDDMEEEEKEVVDPRIALIPKQNIMLIDSNITSRNSMKQQLEDISLQLITPVHDCSVANRTLMESKIPFDIILIDLDDSKQRAIAFLKTVMPLPLAQKLKVILIINSKTDSKLIKEAMDAGAWDSIQVPLRPVDLKAKIINTIEI